MAARGYRKVNIVNIVNVFPVSRAGVFKKRFVGLVEMSTKFTRFTVVL
jgi:hypothetical protein